MSFKFLESGVTSDLELEVTARSLKDFYKSICLAVSDAMVDIKTINQKMCKRITVAGVNTKDLFFNIVEELIYLKDAEQLVFADYKIISSSAKGVVIDCCGEKLNSRMVLRHDLKAPTLHNLSVLHNEKWIGHMVIDL